MKSRSHLPKIFFAIFFFGAVFGPASARAGGMRELRGHVPPAAALSQPLGRLPGTNALHLAISLPLRNQAALTQLLQRLYDPASPDYHHYLTPAQFTENFGPTAQDYQRVIQFAGSNGLEIVTTRESRMLLDVQGKVADVEKAFHVNLQTYQHPTESRRFYAPDVAPSVDADLPILDVAGMGDYAKARPMLQLKPANTKPVSASGSQASGYYLGRDFRNAYAPGVNLTGAGQTVGLLELDGYYSNDIVSYETLAGLPNVPLENVDVTNYTGPPGSDDVEVSLDIEMAIAMAPGLSAVVVFEAGATASETAGFEDILDSMASSNNIKQFSSSWGFTGVTDPDTTMDGWFQKMATQGQSFYQASGDGDAWVNPIWVPADSPYLTSVGGTLLTMNGSGASYSSETVWNEGNQGHKNAWSPNGNGYIGSGGGVSGVYTIPSWQQSAINSTNHGSSSMRNIPDVALTADDIWITYNNGKSGAVAGTSCAAPLWAGFTALVNQQAAGGGSPTVGFLNPAIYTLGQEAGYTSAFHDITTGNNINAQSGGLYTAVTGYDLCTGWGTPNGAGLINALSPEPLQITPTLGFISYGPFGGPFGLTNQVFTLTNIAPAPLNWSVVNTSLWLSVSPSGGTLTSGGAVASVNIGLNSAAASLAPGSYNSTVLFSNLNDTVTQSFQFNLTVSKATPVLSWTNPTAITYGAALTSNQLDATANTPGSFAYTPSNNVVLNVGGHTLSVIFTPTNTTDYNSVTDSVSLVVSPAPLSVKANNAARQYGTANPAFTGTITGVTNGDNITATYSCSATSNSPVGMYSIVPSLVDPNNRLTNYTVSSNNGTLNVTMAAPVLSWPTPSAITYGTALGSNQLDATANVPGSFSYNPSNGMVLNTGTHTLSVLFTPADTVDYSNATGSTSLVVSPAPLSVTASNAARPYGAANPAFTGTIIGVTNGDNITATYNCSATTNSPAGMYSIVPSLVDPNNRLTNYTVSSNNGTLTVTMAVPVLSWPAPSAITYGTALSSNQLNATANVPGSFGYNPSNGMVLDAGTNTLSVLFTPSDTVDYSNATDSASLVVSPAPLSVTASNAARPYGTANPAFTGTIIGVTNGDDITATYSCSATNDSPVGTYSIMPSLVDPNNRQTNYTVSLSNGTLTVTMAVPVLSWPTPSAITYGTALGSNQLDATANTAGSFGYNPSNGTVLDTGTNTLSVLFTPSDTVDYSNATDGASLVVSPALLSVTASNAARPYGAANPAFTGTIIGVTNGDDITATYSCSATNDSPVGMYSIVPSLVDPNNRLTNYTVSSNNGTLTVTMAAPVLSWPVPSAITYGTALGSNQLDATANVPGSFGYNPSAGAVLGPGTNTLGVLFTPGDAVDYSNATDSVSLVVSLVPIALNIQLVGSNVVLCWHDPDAVFALQAAPAITGVFTNVPGAASPYTNAITCAPQYFRLLAN